MQRPESASPEVLRKVEEEARKHEEFQSNPALAYFSVGYSWSQLDLEWEIGLHAFNVSLSIDPTRIMTHFYRGIALVESNRSKEALVSFLACCAPSSLSQLKGYWEDPYYEAACVYRELGDNKKTLELLNLSVTWNKNWDVNHIELAELLKELGHAGKAKALLRAAIRRRVPKAASRKSSGTNPRMDHLTEAYRKLGGAP